MKIEAGHGLREAVAAALRGRPDGVLGVAVSGGGDSVALLLLLHAALGGGIAAVTVDHGLRAASAGEAAGVARLCASLGVLHTVLRWQGWDGRGNLMDAARRARLRLIGDWARGQRIGTVALGHTADDQAETVLMRLARGSGVDGLSAMALRREAEGVVWLRPLLQVRRADLRDYLRARGVGWVDDPTNDDPWFARTRARAVLEGSGLGVEDLAATAARMALAREVLERAAHRAAVAGARIEAGEVVLDRSLLAAEAAETRLRLMAHALRWVTGADYRPRFAALQAAVAQAMEGRRAVLAGAMLSPRQGTIRVGREPRAALAAPDAAPGVVWDGRWVLQADAGRVRALGAAADLCPGRDLPRATRLASPALWDGATLVAAPLAGFGPPVRLEPARPDTGFLASLLSH